jgi:uncharacterized membrane protein HdeD (DUF308 family)
MTDPTAGRSERRQEIVDNARGFLSNSMSDLWWTFLVRGILAAVLGVIALFWPAGSVALLLRIAGVFLLFDGAVTLFGFRNREGGGSESAAGIVSVVIGLILLFLPAASARFVFVLLGLWALFKGGAYLYTWWQMPETDPECATARNIGLATALLGAVLIFWPATGLVAIGWLIAIAAFAVAAVMLFLAFRIKGLRDRVNMRLASGTD